MMNVYLLCDRLYRDEVIRCDADNAKLVDEKEWVELIHSIVVKAEAMGVQDPERFYPMGHLLEAERRNLDIDPDRGIDYQAYLEELGDQDRDPMLRDDFARPDWDGDPNEY